MAAPAILAALGRFGASAGKSAAMSGVPSLASIDGPWNNYIRAKTNALFPNTPLSLEILIALRRFEIIGENEFGEKALELGYERGVSENIRLGAQSLLSAIDYVSLVRRGFIQEHDFRKNLHALGFEDEQIENVLKATLYQPSPTDLVRFAVREVYNPKLRSDFGLDLDRPEAFMREATRAGLSEDFAKDYWASHWELPSMTAGYDMLHRRIINEEQLKDLLKAHDVMPNWRDPLIKLSYHPLTRVDVRRMFSMGVLSEEQVFNSYLDVGYSKENAQLMTNFTKKFERNELSGLSKTQIIRAYKADVISRETALSLYKSIQVPEEVAVFELNLAEFEKSQDDLEELEKELKAQFNLGLINENEFRNALSAEGAPASYVQSAITRLKVSVSQKVKLPARTDLERWFEKRIINEQEYFKGMIKLGYSEKDSRLFMAEILLDNESGERKYLSEKVYVRWVQKGIISKEEASEILKGKKLSESDINRLLLEAQSGTGEQ